jgi:hypothetical protein
MLITFYFSNTLGFKSFSKVFEKKIKVVIYISLEPHCPTLLSISQIL